MKTAIQSLRQEIAKAIEHCESQERLNVYQPLLHRLDYYEQKEREQIEKAYETGLMFGKRRSYYVAESIKTANERYYNQTYKSE